MCLGNVNIYSVSRTQNRDRERERAEHAAEEKEEGEIGGLVRDERNTAVLRSAFCLNRIPVFPSIFRRSDFFGNYCVT